MRNATWMISPALAFAIFQVNARFDAGAGSSQPDCFSFFSINRAKLIS